VTLRSVSRNQITVKAKTKHRIYMILLGAAISAIPSGLSLWKRLNLLMVLRLRM
jgi:hypothetical protein